MNCCPVKVTISSGGDLIKKFISLVSMRALALTVSTSAFASQGTVERSVNLHSAPSTDSNVYGLLKTGTKFQVLERVNSYWLKISADGKVGYVSTDYVSTSGSSPAPSEPSTSKPASGAADRIIQHAKNLQGTGGGHGIRKTQGATFRSPIFRRATLYFLGQAVKTPSTM
ncbi:MAG: SH3 domain-containing protein [Paenibacillaceae bacterium]